MDELAPALLDLDQALAAGAARGRKLVLLQEERSLDAPNLLGLDPDRARLGRDDRVEPLRPQPLGVRLLLGGLDLAGDPRVLGAERVGVIGPGDQIGEAVRREDHFHRARLAALVEVDEALVEALDGDPVLVLEREEALGLDLVELRQAIELLLVERESVLDRDEPRGDVTDALRQGP